MVNMWNNKNVKLKSKIEWVKWRRDEGNEEDQDNEKD